MQVILESSGNSTGVLYSKEELGLKKLKQVENIELNLNGEKNGTNKDEGNSISRK